MHQSVRERAKAGKAARAGTPRSNQAAVVADERRDPLALLAADVANRHEVCDARRVLTHRRVAPAKVFTKLDISSRKELDAALRTRTRELQPV
jgi:hypothetical protein